MDDNAPQENPPSGFNKIDLTQLQGFSFGTQWTQDKQQAGRQDDRPRRDGGEGRPRGDGPDRRDRRAFRRPAGGPGGPSGGGEGGQGEGRPPRRESSGREDDRGPRGEFRGPGRRGPGGDRRGEFRGEPRHDPRIPYDSPHFHTTFYPEDASFATLARTIRSSCRTFELFDIARTVIAKPDRFVVVLHRKPPGGSPAPSAAPADGETQSAAKLAPIAISVPDGIPFESEEAAIAHVLGKHLGNYFDIAEVEVEAPKGNFQVVNKCGVTGELLAPPNYHRYSQIVQQHFASKIARMPFETYKARIETVRDPEAIAQWLEKMKKAVRYTWKERRSGKKEAPAAPVAAPAETPATEPAAAPATPATEPATPAAVEAAPSEASAAPAAQPALSFDTFEEARSHLLGHGRERVVRLVESARFHGNLLESIPPGEIRRAIEGALDRQRRFPLDTANALRGRLRREGFTIFKKGAKGVSYVCAVKRRFRVPGQVFSDSISSLISFIEGHPMVKASELAQKFLQLPLPAAPDASAASVSTPPMDAAEAAKVPEVTLTQEQREQLARMQGDLRWLVHEGYVTEFINGALYAAPPMVEARKREIETAEHDPENFPDAPAAAAASPVRESSAPESAEPVPTAEAPSGESQPPTETPPESPPAPTGSA